MEQLLSFANTSFETLIAACQALFLPLVFFVLIGYLVKRNRLITDVRRAFPESLLNIKIWLFNLLFTIPILAIISQALHSFVHSTGFRLFDDSFWEPMPPVLVAFIAVFIGDFTSYWRHRLAHTPLLWPAHATHHSDTEMTWFAITRFHPIDHILILVVDSSALLLLGFPPYAVLANLFMRKFYGAFIHADLPWDYGKLGRIFVSPAMHRWHHARDPRFFQKNFAGVFCVFDQLFGTYLVPGRCNAKLGITDDVKMTLRAQFLFPFMPRAYRRIREGSATLFRWKSMPDEAKVTSAKNDDTQTASPKL